MKIILFLLFLVEVHCQLTYPYVSFGLAGQTLVNNSYVDLSTVGSASSDSVVCHSDLSVCCSGSQGSHRGDWYFPDGTILPFGGTSVPIYEYRGAQRVTLHHTTATGPTGIYRCDISTNALHDFTDTSVRARVYVGLYVGNGGKHSPLFELLWYIECLWCKMALAIVCCLAKFAFVAVHSHSQNNILMSPWATLVKHFYVELTLYERHPHTHPHTPIVRGRVSQAVWMCRSLGQRISSAVLLLLKVLVFSATLMRSQLYTQGPHCGKWFPDCHLLVV